MWDGAYVSALRVGYQRVRETEMLTANHQIEIQTEPERNRAGLQTAAASLSDGRLCWFQSRLVSLPWSRSRLRRSFSLTKSVVRINECLHGPV